MKWYIFCSLIIFGLIGGCASTKIEDNNQTIEHNNITDVNNTCVINLDEKLKKDYTKGSLIDNNTIPIDISRYQNPNDEVKFVGKILIKTKKIKFIYKSKNGTNDEVAFSGKEYKVKTSELKDGDMISLVDKNNKTLVNMIIRTY